jgi:hypothetical protein
MTSDPKPQDPQLDQEEELGLEVLDEVAGAGLPEYNMSFN